MSQAKRQSDIAALVRELRRHLDLTQEQFAQRVGVTYSTVNHWENGKRVPQPFLLRRLLQMEGELDALGKKSTKEKSGLLRFLDRKPHRPSPHRQGGADPTLT